jgi:FkbM family methyltransferase
LTEEATPEQAVAVLYRAALGRAPEPAGLAFYAAQLRAGAGIAMVLRAILASDEYLKRSQDPAGFRRIEREGCAFLLPPEDPLTLSLAAEGGYEPWALPRFLAECRPGMAVLDIGAAWGFYAIPAARRVGPAGRVVAIEPSARNGRILLRNARENGLANVGLLPFATGQRLGLAYLPAEDRTGNAVARLPRRLPRPEPEAVEPVAVLPLNALRRQIGPVQLVKMDVEGMELATLRGGRALFRESRPVTYLEYAPPLIAEAGGEGGPTLLRLFLEDGYAIEVLHQDRPAEAMPAEPEAAIRRTHGIWEDGLATHGRGHLDLRLAPRG